MKTICALLFVFCVAAVQARTTQWGISVNEDNTKDLSHQSRFRDRETAISEEATRLVHSFNKKDSSESDSDEDDKNTFDNNVALKIFQNFGSSGDWWRNPSVLPMLVKIAERVARTPALQQEWKVKEIVKQTENSFKYCKMGNQYDRGCMGARMGNIQKYITSLESQTRDEEESDS
ncbi:hypothetical protein ACFFRR_006469 [Megaselia abdita]